ncbi:Protein fam78a [Branchiostoma belcheri]|nr:Protein fam78a [Branchiostoma belcheri]
MRGHVGKQNRYEQTPSNRKQCGGNCSTGPVKHGQIRGNDPNIRDINSGNSLQCIRLTGSRTALADCPSVRRGRSLNPSLKSAISPPCASNLNSSWEIPSLKTGEYKMISDSDGVLYPWYGATTEVAVVEGPTHSPLKVELSMNDNFYPSVTWDTPVSSGNFPHLTRITRDQGFTTWLAVMNLDSGEVRPLRTIKWRMRLQIEVEPLEDAGKRARLVGTGKQEQPYILTNNQPIPETALRKPNANDAQMLVWRPQKGPPVVVVPPKAQR